MRLYQVSVKPEARQFYFPGLLHEGLGIVWQKDEEHIWFKFFRQDIQSKKIYLSSPCRYPWEDINTSLVSFEEELDTLRPLPFQIRREKFLKGEI